MSLTLIGLFLGVLAFSHELLICVTCASAVAEVNINIHNTIIDRHFFKYIPPLY